MNIIKMTQKMFDMKLNNTRNTNTCTPVTTCHTKVASLYEQVNTGEREGF